MKREDISRAVGEIDTAYIEEAAEEHTELHRKQRWLKPLVSLAACAAIAVTVATLREPACESAVNSGAADYQTAEDDVQAGAPGDGSTMEDVASQNETAQKEKQKLHCNEAQLEGAAAEALYELDAESFVPMSREELLTYYRAELPVAECLPELLPAASEQTLGVYRRKQGSVYHDINTFAFANGDGSERVEITLSRVSHAVGVEPQRTEEGALRFTNVNGRDLVVFRDAEAAGKPLLSVQWMQDGTGWQVWSTGVPEETFQILLSCLVKPTEPMEINICKGKLLAIDQAARRVAIQAENGETLGIQLPQDTDWTALHLDDRVRVIWRGEPATLGTVWAEQLLEFTLLKGVQS